ncbi:MAG TPA: NUDIX domain-containing protein [Actinotalea caeni]|uniref:NUDIX hydrolase n=1 Tax=Actinotalea caeni TaxID=1348467 RepID=UPI002B4B8982|nr:NUDIX domain-containing protein [Actinotalea caeni]HLV56811.1 NUDIX domain-containing protein [Actinotalea caeni]
MSSTLGPEWVRGADGKYFRTAARVLLIDEHDRVLLVRGHDVDRPERSWWFTIGGGIDRDERPEDAAVRELAEETGLSIDVSDLVGPVLTRSAIFDFEREHVRQDEVFFVARIRDAGELSRDGWTAVERSFMDEMRWWSPADLREVDIEVFPAELPEVVEHLLDGWDGTVRHLGLQDDDATGEAVPQ